MGLETYGPVPKGGDMSEDMFFEPHVELHALDARYLGCVQASLVRDIRIRSDSDN